MIIRDNTNLWIAKDKLMINGVEIDIEPWCVGVVGIVELIVVLLKEFVVIIGWWILLLLLLVLLLQLNVVD